MNKRFQVRWIAAGAALALSGGIWIFLKKPAAPAASPAPAAAAAPVESDKTLLAQADAALAQGSYAEAQRLYQQVLQRNPAAAAAAQAQQRIGEANLKLLFSSSRMAGDTLYTVQPGDSLSRIARKNGTTVELLRISNGLRGDLIRAGQSLKISGAKFSVIVDKSQNLLTLKNGEEVTKVYRCSTGAGGITPAGDFKIVSRMVDPVWKGMVQPGDPENPLGTRWLGFNLPEYGIHGTPHPETVGQPVTKGCVRLLNSDVEELYNLLPEGTVVTIVE